MNRSSVSQPGNRDTAGSCPHDEIGKLTRDSRRHLPDLDHWQPFTPDNGMEQGKCPPNVEPGLLQGHRQRVRCPPRVLVTSHARLALIEATSHLGGPTANTCR
jgi:hypothetical protein